MKIIQIKAGLGNQIFQYAYGRKLMLEDHKKVVFDISFFRGNKSKVDSNRPFLLSKFNISKDVIFKDWPEHTLIKLSKKILRKIGINIDEFFQSEKYFKKIEKNIREEITLKDKLSDSASTMLKIIKSTENPISLHVRRTDILDPKNPYGGICDIDYYKQAESLIKQKVGIPSFFVFSDDIAWCKNNLNFINPIYFVSNPKIPDYEELILMSSCKHNVIANSSFSWWAAWLNRNPEKIIIAPKKWIKRNEKIHKDTVPSEWIRI